MPPDTVEVVKPSSGSRALSSGRTLYPLGSGDIMKPVHCLAALPIAAFYSGGWLAEHVGTRLAGLPFLMAWNIVWLLLTSVVMGVMFRFDGSREAARASTNDARERDGATS
jgi:hypothetical protein